MNEQTPREILADADRWKRRADAADYARTLIRLGEPVQYSRGLFGFWKKNPQRPHVLDEWTTDAVYDALAKVESDARRYAKDLESRVGVSRDVAS